MIKHLLLNTPIFPFKGTWWPFYVQCPGLWVTRSGFKTWMGHCVVFLGKISYSHRASLNPGVEMSTRASSGKPDEMPRGNLVMD